MDAQKPKPTCIIYSGVAALMLIPKLAVTALAAERNISPFGSGSYAGKIAGARYGVISNNGKTITIVTFGSVDATGVDEESSGPHLGLRDT